MHLSNLEQGTQEWFDARLGRVTASIADQLVTPGGKASASQDRLLERVLYEQYTGMPFDRFDGNTDTIRGHEAEPKARDWFRQTHHGVSVLPAGLCVHEAYPNFACSPDGICSNGLWMEIKAPRAGKHLRFLAEAPAHSCPKEYFVQVQFSLWLTGAKGWYWISYYDGLPPVERAVDPDQKMITAFDTEAKKFNTRLIEARAKLENMGVKFALELR